MIAAEQKARSTYDNILRVVRDMPEIADPIKFLRAREVVHFQRFGEALRSIQEELDAKNFYAFNPSRYVREVYLDVLHLAMDANNHIKIAIYKEEKCSVFEWNTFLLYVILHGKQNPDE